MCGSGKCNRHRPGPTSHARQPWVGLEVPDEIDEAVEDVSWYTNGICNVINHFHCCIFKDTNKAYETHDSKYPQDIILFSYVGYYILTMI